MERLRQLPAGSRLRERVGSAAADAGRAPGEVGATAAVLVELAGGVGRVMGDSSHGSPGWPVPDGHRRPRAAMAAAGAAHLQLVLDPITEDSIETVGEALALLDAG